MNLKKIQYIVLIIFICMTLIGIFGLLFYPPNIIKTNHTATTSDGVIISYNLYQPIGLTGPTPVVVMGHGIIVNKEMMTNFAVELAARGYIVASLDWRGHGLSTGSLDIAKLPLDLEAVIANIPLQAPYADMSTLALSGYSMGGWPTFEYARAHNDTVKAWVGIATFGDATFANLTNPNNALIVVGTLDEGFSATQVKACMVNLTTAVSVNDFKINTLYGNMTNGTARKLQMVPGVDHLMAPWTRDFVVASANWISESFGDTTTSAFSLYVFDVRIILLVIGFSGTCGLVAITGFILANKLRIRKEEGEDKMDGLKEDMLMDHSTLSFIGKYYGYTFLLLPTIAIFAVLFLIPLPLTALLAMLVGCLGVNLTIYCWRLSKRHDVWMETVFKENLFQKPKIWIYSIILGVVFFLGYEFTVGLNYISIIPSLNRLIYLILYGPLCFIGFFFLGIFIQKYATPFLYSKLEGKHPVTQYIVASFVNFLLIYSWFLILILGACLLMGSFFFAMILILMVPIFATVSFFAVYMEKITGSVIPGAILSAIFLSATILTLTPMFSILDFMGIFVQVPI